jgi:hypothetical protein
MKTKLGNRLQQLYSEKGYNFSTDNRCPYTKSINQALATGQIKIELCRKGCHWERKKDGFKYRLRIVINDMARIYFFKGEPTPEYICDCVGKLLNRDDVRINIKIHEDAYKCDKCGGKGYIIAFKHVCQGVCFSCLGLGYRFHSNN